MSPKQDLPLVSIITPSYNQAQFLEATLQSVLEQDYPNLEYIVIDGGSTDGSQAIIEKYADRLTYWASEPDQGQAEAINKGLAQAKGEIVAWLNSDDVYRPGAIRRAVECLQANPDLGMVYGQLDSIDPEGHAFNTIRYRQLDLADLLAFHIIGQPAVFMRRRVVAEAGGLDPEYKFLLDHHLWIRIARLAPIEYVPEVWAAARQHAGAKNVAQAGGFGEEALHILDWAKEQPDLAALIRNHPRKVRGGAYRLAARYLLDGGEPGQALKAYLRVLVNDPGRFLQHGHRVFYALLMLLHLEWVVPRRTVFDQRPILVTGAHRSGTSWVGKMLAQGGHLAYVSEPLNVHHRPGVMATPVPRWYEYLCTGNEGLYLKAFTDTTKLNYHTWSEIKSLRSPKDIGRMLRDWTAFAIGRSGGRRVLLKDPFAFFSAAWFAERLDCEVVIVLRHPAAFVSSLKRLGWAFDFRDLLNQPLLMRDWLEPFRAEMEAAAEGPEDLILQGSLLWRIIARVARQLQQAHPDFHIVRHEDLSRDPLEGFAALYAGLGLPFTTRARRGIRRATSAANPGERAQGAVYTTRLDSAANLDNWKARLSADEIARIKELTADAWPLYYGEEDWS